MSVVKTHFLANKISRILVLSVLLVITIFGFLNYQTNSNFGLKTGANTGTNNANLIIGSVDTGAAIEYSACLQNTGDAIRLTDSSLWIGFDNSQLTPVPTPLQTGIFSSGNGYGALQFKQVPPPPVSTAEKWTLATFFPGTGTTPETGGYLIPDTAELIAKVKFNKIGNPVNPVISIQKKQYYTIEYGLTPITLNVINLTTDCNYIPNCTNGATNPTACNVCTGGNYYDAVTSTCKSCPAGSSCTGGTLPPTQCLAGTYSGAGATTCSTCPSGQTSPAGANAQTQCYPTVCANGATTAPACNICPSGQYLSVSVCTPCPVGSYCPAPPVACLTATCIPPTCPSGQTSPAGANAQTQCYPTVCANGATTAPACNICTGGNYYDAVTSTCKSCPAGSSCTGPTPPTQCLAGTYSIAGSTTCTTCPPGTSCANPGTTDPTPCLTGTYSGQGAITCTQCPAGSTTITQCLPANGGVIIITNQSSSSSSKSSSTSSISIDPNLDTDKDGTPDNVENQGPNNGDSNYDGIKDYLQKKVITLATHNPSGDENGYVTIELNSSDLDGGCADPKIIKNIIEKQIFSQDVDYEYPYGLIDLKVECLDKSKSPGTLTMRTFWHNITDWSEYSYRKYGTKLPGTLNSDSWFGFDERTNSKTNIPLEFSYQLLDNIKKAGIIKFTLTDGQLGDDTQLDGFIVDPSGPSKKLTQNQKIVEKIVELTRTGGNVAATNSILILGSVIAILICLAWLARPKFAEEGGNIEYNSTLPLIGKNSSSVIAIIKSWYTSLLSLVTHHEWNKDPFADTFGASNFQSQSQLDPAIQAIINTTDSVHFDSIVSSSKLQNNVQSVNDKIITDSHIVIEPSESKLFASPIIKPQSKKTIILEPVFKSIKPQSELDFESAEMEILNKIKFSKVDSWSLWLELADMYNKFQELDKAKQTYSFVVKNSKGSIKEMAKIKLMEIF
jgi:hypothetical protein